MNDGTPIDTSTADSLAQLAQDVVSFPDYAKARGAETLPELIEAAASHITFIEGQEQFSRPDIIRRVSLVDPEMGSREEKLRAFGQLLRLGKISKVTGGTFSVTDNIDFKPDDSKPVVAAAKPAEKTPAQAADSVMGDAAEAPAEEPEISSAGPMGGAIFGTGSGLTVKGIGSLQKADLFEFEFGRNKEELSSLEGQGFRKEIIVDGEEKSIVGYVQRARDDYNRVGFIGACLECPEDASEEVIQDAVVRTQEALSKIDTNIKDGTKVSEVLSNGQSILDDLIMANKEVDWSVSQQTADEAEASAEEPEISFTDPFVESPEVEEFEIDKPVLPPRPALRALRELQENQRRPEPPLKRVPTGVMDDNDGGLDSPNARGARVAAALKARRAKEPDVTDEVKKSEKPIGQTISKLAQSGLAQATKYSKAAIAIVTDKMRDGAKAKLSEMKDKRDAKKEEKAKQQAEWEALSPEDQDYQTIMGLKNPKSYFKKELNWWEKLRLVAMRSDDAKHAYVSSKLGAGFAKAYAEAEELNLTDGKTVLSQSEKQESAPKAVQKTNMSMDDFQAQIDAYKKKPPLGRLATRRLKANKNSLHDTSKDAVTNGRILREQMGSEKFYAYQVAIGNMSAEDAYKLLPQSVEMKNNTDNVELGHIKAREKTGHWVNADGSIEEITKEEALRRQAEKKANTSENDDTKTVSPFEAALKSSTASFVEPDIKTSKADIDKIADVVKGGLLQTETPDVTAIESTYDTAADTQTVSLMSEGSDNATSIDPVIAEKSDPMADIDTATKISDVEKETGYEFVSVRGKTASVESAQPTENKAAEFIADTVPQENLPANIDKTPSKVDVAPQEKIDFRKQPRPALNGKPRIRIKPKI